MAKTKERLTKAQSMYKDNYDARLRKQSKVIHKGDYVYLLVQHKSPYKHHHKLALIKKGPYNVSKIGDKTVDI